MLQQRQLEQRRHIAYQLGGDDKHQNRDQYRAQRNRLNAFHALHRGAGIPQPNIFQEAKSRMNL